MYIIAFYMKKEAPIRYEKIHESLFNFWTLNVITCVTCAETRLSVACSRLAVFFPLPAPIVFLRSERLLMRRRRCNAKIKRCFA